jgi:hypothetical protein
MALAESCRRLTVIAEDAAATAACEQPVAASGFAPGESSSAAAARTACQAAGRVGGSPPPPPLGTTPSARGAPLRGAAVPRHRRRCRAAAEAPPGDLQHRRYGPVGVSEERPTMVARTTWLTLANGSAAARDTACLSSPDGTCRGALHKCHGGATTSQRGHIAYPVAAGSIAAVTMGSRKRALLSREAGAGALEATDVRSAPAYEADDADGGDRFSRGYRSASRARASSRSRVIALTVFSGTATRGSATRWSQRRREAASKAAAVRMHLRSIPPLRIAIGAALAVRCPVVRHCGRWPVLFVCILLQLFPMVEY